MSQSEEPAVRALRELREQLAATVGDLETAADRLAELAELRAAGRSWSEIVLDEDRPLIVETITQALDDLGAVGSRFRREEARALHREEMGISRIGQLFGVSRQRISALIHGGPSGDRPEPGRADESGGELRG
ncbi:hypothetical protein ACLFMI_16365 [Pseudonocardia nantongensis]|uniref:hypothetical protein n=1 Tax=Pseudonocardia nantongensis TaxID=1181885 RepID=UPI00397D6BEA